MLDCAGVASQPALHNCRNALYLAVGYLHAASELGAALSIAGCAQGCDRPQTAGDTTHAVPVLV